MKDSTRKIKLYYADIRNMGDQLNVLLLRDYFGYKIERHPVLTGELSAIGSGLDQYLNGGAWRRRSLKKIYGTLFPRAVIWGTGFINYPVREDPAFFKRNMMFCAVRGEMSRLRAERITGRKLDIPVGDPGILASELISGVPEKQYDMGIIPHVCDLGHPIVTELMKNIRNSRLIKVTDAPGEVIRQIAECRTVLSGSLHGLVVADSFQIPNLHGVISDRPLGDGYKFDDYYSAYGITHRSVNLRKDRIDSPQQIRDGYQLTEEMVQEKKNSLLQCFPYPINNKNINEAG